MAVATCRAIATAAAGVSVRKRIRVYPDKGFQMPQGIPDDIWDAFEQLVDKGYNKRLVDARR